MSTASSATVVTSRNALLRPDDNRTHELVVPRLLARIPQHPEVAEEEEERQEAGEVATDRSARPDSRLQRLLVDHPDRQRHLADGLALRTAFEDRVVHGREREARDERRDRIDAHEGEQD